MSYRAELINLHRLRHVRISLRYMSLACLVYSVLLSCSDPPPQHLSALPVGGSPLPPDMEVEEDGGEEPVEPVNPFAPRPATQACVLPTPPALAPMTLRSAELWAQKEPTSFALTATYPDSIFVSERRGSVWMWTPPTQPALFFDSDASAETSAEGLYGLAFHPNFEANRRVYTLKSSRECEAGAYCVVLSRWRAETVPPPVVDPSSEERLLEVPFDAPQQMRGQLLFGADGFLYVGIGAGEAGDSAEPARASLKGSVLRLNVDERDDRCNTLYRVPPTNPFAGSGCETDTPDRAELWAWGFSAPHQLSFDPINNALWVTDQRAQGEGAQEVNRVVGGGDYEELPPTYEHLDILQASPSPLRGLVGGGVYRGDEYPELRGQYLLSDQLSGLMVAFPVNLPEQASAMIDVERTDARGVKLWLQGRDGVIRLGGKESASGELLRLTSNEEAPAPETQTPRLLSETGCFSDLRSGRFADTVIPYEVNRPFWSDYAEKERAFALPVGAQLEYVEASKGLSVPVGGVLIKHLYMRDTQGSRRLFETRLMHHSERGWMGHTYRWREDGSDADLLDTGYEAQLAGPMGEMKWSFLNPSTCLDCHTEASGRTLGLEASQLNRPIPVEGGSLNQLEAWVDAGYLSLPLPASELASLIPVEEEIELSREAREYLQVNCASCHRPDGVSHLSFDLRADTPLAETGVCDALPTLGDLGIEEARLLAPGAPERSLILTRMRQRGVDQMPPVGSHFSDVEGVALITLWISQLQGCDE